MRPLHSGRHRASLPLTGGPRRARGDGCRSRRPSQLLTPITLSIAGLGVTVALVHGAVGASFGAPANASAADSALALSVQTWTSAADTPGPTSSTTPPSPASAPSSEPSPASSPMPSSVDASGVASAVPMSSPATAQPSPPPPTIDPAKAWVRPLTKGEFTSSFGPRWGTQHQGIDLAAPMGTPISAMSAGRVRYAGWQGGYGNKVEILYWDGTVSAYGHMSRTEVKAGDNVVPGTRVGTVGNTGDSTGSHLHLEIHPKSRKATDPEPWLSHHGVPAR